MLINKIG